MRMIDLPPLNSPKEIASAVRFQASEHIPMPLEQAILEHQSLGIVHTGDGPRTRVVLVAARRDMIDRLLEATARAGLRPHGMDLSAFAMIRALYRPAAGGSTLYISVGGMTNLAVAAARDMLVHPRRCTGNGVDGRRARRAPRTDAGARARLAQHVGLLMPIDDLAGDGTSSPRPATCSVKASAGLRTRCATRLISTARRGRGPVQQPVLTGPRSQSQGSRAAWREVGLPLEVGVVRRDAPEGSTASTQADSRSPLD